MRSPFCARQSLQRCLLYLLVSLICGLPVRAQQAVALAPLSADEVMERVAEMNDQRSHSLVAYSGLRTYHLECHCLSHKSANMVVRIDYHAPVKKDFTVVSESGSGTIRERVFKELLKAEQESMRLENQQQSALTRDNYTVELLEYQKTGANEAYVLKAQPRRSSKFLFRGRIWVDARDFAITRIEGEPAVNPSWWTEKNNFTRTYQKIGEFWLPESNESHSKVRMFGTAVLTIEYGDYSLQKDETKVAFSESLPTR
jgi:outer membrane lipoprotein-sorting protein